MGAVRILWVAITGVALASCADLVTDVREAEPALIAAAAPYPPGCTHRWANGVDGDFHDASKWSPKNVPNDTTEHACITAPGTYTVTDTGYVYLRGLTVGGTGAHATLDVVEQTLRTNHEYLVAAEGRIVTRMLANNRRVYLIARDTIRNYGTIEIVNDGGTSVYAAEVIGRIANHGTLLVPGGAYFALGVVNRGSFVEDSPYGSLVHHGFRQESGSVSGTSKVQVDDTIRWEGGTLEANPGGDPVLRTHAWSRPWPPPTLILAASALTGEVGAGGEDDTESIVEGDIGPDVALHLLGSERQTFVFDTTAGTPVRNQGRLRMHMPGPTQPPDAPRVIFPVLHNEATFELTGAGAFRLQADSVVNAGTVTIDGALIVEGYGAAFQNDGTIAATSGSVLQMSKSTLISGPAGVMTGLLWLQGGQLEGEGSVGDVLSINGNVRPGHPIGTLRAGSVVMDTKSALFIQVADTATGGYDRLVTTGSLDYAGTLNVVTDPTFTGARCGDLLAFVEAGSITPRSAFGKLTGLGFLGVNRAWRLHEDPTELLLVGHAPRTGVVTDPLYPTVTEGGPDAPYHVCLGVTRPTAAVTVTPTVAQGQVSGPAPVTFDLSTWDLPRTVDLRAVDDALVEGVHSDTITHAVSSADPGYGGTFVPPMRVTVIDNDDATDLALTWVSQEDNQFVGDTMNTVVRVTNLGPARSSGSTVSAAPLVGLELVAASGATCTVDGAGALTCRLAAIDVGAAIDLTLTLRGATAGLHSNVLTVTGDAPDPNAANDTLVYTQRVN
ncbi:MAG: DUF11 domain-containing protein [Gemmatimonadota bacterium]